jgi:hypothetical protein
MDLISLTLANAKRLKKPTGKKIASPLDKALRLDTLPFKITV